MQEQISWTAEVEDCKWSTENVEAVGLDCEWKPTNAKQHPEILQVLSSERVISASLFSVTEKLVKTLVNKW